MPNLNYITLENAPELIGKTVDCFKRVCHHYPLTIIQGVNTGRYFIVDRNAVAIPIGEHDKIPYDFIVEEATT